MHWILDFCGPLIPIIFKAEKPFSLIKVSRARKPVR